MLSDGVLCDLFFKGDPIGRLFIRHGYLMSLY